MQVLVGRPRYGELLDWSLSVFEQWSASPEALSAVEAWNDVAALAVSTEPHTHPRIFGTLRWAAGIDEQTQRKRIDELCSGKTWAVVTRPAFCRLTPRLFP